MRKRARAALAAAVSAMLVTTVVPFVATSAQASEAAAFPISVDYAVDAGAVEHVGGGILHAFDDRGPAQWLTDGIGLTAVRGMDYSRRASPYNEYLPGWFEAATRDRLQRMSPDAALMIGTYYGFKGRVAAGLYDNGNMNWQDLALKDSGSAYKEWIAEEMADAAAKDIDVHSWIVWNEPDAQWSNRSAYFTGHKNGFDGVKAVDPDALVQAPEISAFRFDFLTEFLTYCKANHCVPDVLSWHELTKDRTAIEDHTTRMTEWLVANDIPVMPFAITEYQGTGYSTTEAGRRAQGNYNPGLAVSYLGEFERASESSSLQFALRSEWGLPGGDPNARGYLGEMATFDDKGKMATGLWYVYNAYWDMSGRKIGTAHDKTNLDALATYDADPRVNQSHLLVGNWQETAKSVPVTLKNIPSDLIIDGRVNIQAELISETLATPSYGTTPVISRNVAVHGGTASFTLDLPARSAMKVAITTPTGAPTRFSATGAEGTEQAQVTTTGQIAATPAVIDGTGYVTYSGGTPSSYTTAGGAETAQESGDSVTYTVSVAESGVYRLSSELVATSSGAFVQLYLDGVSTGVPFDLYAPSSTALQAYHANTYLSAGEHQVTYRIVGTGKNAASSGYDVNIADVLLAAPGRPTDEVTVTLNAMTGRADDVTQLLLTEGSPVGILPVPTWADHVFLGWNTKMDGSGENVTSSTVASPGLHLYGQWRALGELVYFVDAGDMDPATLSPGASFGSYNSVTDQFFAADPVTGREWGVLDTPQASTAYPNLLTGQYTWPAENLGYTDATSSLQTYRYARGQAQPLEQRLGVPYRFELENGNYDVSLTIATGWSAQVDKGYKATVVFNKGAADAVTVLAPTVLSKDFANPIRVDAVATVTDGYLTINVDMADALSGSVMVNEIAIRRVVEDAVPLVSAQALVRCIAGRAVVSTAVTNLTDQRVDAVVTSSFGESTVSGLAADATRSVAHASRQKTIPAGSVTVTVPGSAVSVTADYPARTCG